jgi:hypothetical protein
MVFRRDVLQALGGFDEALGMQGAKLSYGEETELMMRMHAAGLAMYYSPDIVVEHAILDYKMRLRWLLASAYRNGLSGLGPGGREAVSGLRYSASLLRGAGRALYTLACAKERHLKTRLYRALTPLMWQAGYFVSLLRRPAPPGRRSKHRA